MCILTVSAIIRGSGVLFYKLQQNPIGFIFATMAVTICAVSFLKVHFSKPYTRPLSWILFPFSAIPRNSKEVAAVAFVFFMIVSVLVLVFWQQISLSVAISTEIIGVGGMVCAYYWYRNRSLPWLRNMTALIALILVGILLRGGC